jgi:DNA repair protein RecO (recombination protein O)
MPRPRVYKTEAIVLKRTSLGEADSIVTFYTPSLGKIRAVAKGVRRPKSRLGGHLDLLTQSSLLLAQGQNLDVITQSQTIESFLPLKSSLTHIGCALYIAELVDQFTAEHVENYPVYRLLHSTLLWLCAAPSGELPLRHFELGLLSHLGYRPELHHCLGCKSRLAPTTNLFSASSGGVLCPNCAGSDPAGRPITVDALKVMRFLLTNDLETTSRLRMGPDLSREVEQLMRWYTSYFLEREVKSVGFLDHLRARPDFANTNAAR